MKEGADRKLEKYEIWWHWGTEISGEKTSQMQKHNKAKDLLKVVNNGTGRLCKDINF